MDGLTPEQARLRDRARELAREAAAQAAETDRSGAYPWPMVQRMAEAGFTGLTVPRAWGGPGGDYFDAALVIEEFSKACAVCGRISVEANMGAIGAIMAYGTDAQKRIAADLVLAGDKPAILITEPEAGSAATEMTTRAVRHGDRWVINGRKAFITGAEGSKVGIVMAKSEDGACMFLVELPDPAITIERVLDTIDSSMPGGHAVVKIENLRVSADQMLGASGEGFKYAQIRLSPARLSHCMRWLGACIRAQEIASEYAYKRMAFGKQLIDHEGVGFMLAENMIDIKQSELMIDWCAGVLDSGSLGTSESSMAKVAVSEALMRIADKCVQVMGGTGVTQDTIVEQVFREVRAFRIYDGPTEVHKWSLAKRIKREVKQAQPA